MCSQPDYELEGQFPEGAAGIGRERVATMVQHKGIDPPPGR